MFNLPSRDLLCVCVSPPPPRHVTSIRPPKHFFFFFLHQIWYFSPPPLSNFLAPARKRGKEESRAQPTVSKSPTCAFNCFLSPPHAASTFSSSDLSTEAPAGGFPHASTTYSSAVVGCRKKVSGLQTVLLCETVWRRDTMQRKLRGTKKCRNFFFRGKRLCSSFFLKCSLSLRFPVTTSVGTASISIARHALFFLFTSLRIASPISLLLLSTFLLLGRGGRLFGKSNQSLWRRGGEMESLSSPLSAST